MDPNAILFSLGTLLTNFRRRSESDVGLAFAWCSRLGPGVVEVIDTTESTRIDDVRRRGRQDMGRYERVALFVWGWLKSMDCLSACYLRKVSKILRNFYLRCFRKSSASQQIIRFLMFKRMNFMKTIDGHVRIIKNGLTYSDWLSFHTEILRF